MAKTKTIYKKQLSLDYNSNNKVFRNAPLSFGGESLKTSHPKTARPITTKETMHIVLRSSVSKGDLSFFYKNRKNRIIEIINRNAHRFDIKIYTMAVNFDHIHLLIKLKYRDTFSKFIKAITGLISRLVLGAEKGSPVIKMTGKFRKFWDYRPFSRIVAWGKAYIEAKLYIMQNVFEAEGFIPYTFRKKSVFCRLRRSHY